MDNDFKNKLLHYESRPPQKAWEQIAAALDQDTDNTLARLLSHYQQMPDARNWEQIKNKLDHSPVSSTTVRKTNFKPLKYAGIAAAILGMAIIINLLLSKKSESEIPKQAGTQTIPSQVQKTDTKVVQEPSPANETASRPQKNNRTATASFSTPGPLAASIAEPLRNLTASVEFERLFPKQATEKKIIRDNELADKYIIYSDEEGKAFRLSKKLYDSYACPSSAAIDCKQKIRELQQKVASSAITADFTGLLDILNRLKENQ